MRHRSGTGAQRALVRCAQDLGWQRLGFLAMALDAPSLKCRREKYAMPVATKARLCCARLHGVALNQAAGRPVVQTERRCVGVSCFAMVRDKLSCRSRHDMDIKIALCKPAVGGHGCRGRGDSVAPPACEARGAWPSMIKSSRHD